MQLLETIDFFTGERIDYISYEELTKVCNALYSYYKLLKYRKKGLKFLRDCFIFSFLFFTGARIAEFRLSQKMCVNFSEMNYYVPQIKKKYWRAEVDIEDYIDPFERFENGLIKYVIVPLDHVPDK
ncbi:hypothetical protein, partial [Methanocaldococcus sp.]